MPATYAEQMQHIANDYLATVGNTGATTRDIARWAIANGRWSAPRALLESRCAEDLADAMRQEHITDSRGRKVRAKHVANILENGKQLMLWADIRTAAHSHMERAFKLRRQQIVGDSYQLKQDVDWYNDNRRPARPIQIPLDFSLDVRELEAVSIRRSA
jgi:hypothetical protein